MPSSRLVSKAQPPRKGFQPETAKSLGGRLNEERRKESAMSENNVDRRDLLKGAAVGLGALGLGVAGAGTAEAATLPRSKVRRLITKMASDPDFAKQVVLAPENFQAEYGLSTRTVMSLRSLKLEDFSAFKVHDAVSFAQGAMMSAGLVRCDFGNVFGTMENVTKLENEVAIDVDVCYYFG
jgi:hypothetical protein